MLPFPVLNKYGNIAPAAPKIKKVQVGQNHVVALSSTGILYGRGRNSSGQLGIGNTSTQLVWVQLKENVKDVWCSSDGTLIQMNDGTYMCAGVMRLVSATTYSTFTDCSSAFSTLPSSFIITQLVVGTLSTMILMSNNTLWGCGPNSNSELTGTGVKYGTFVQLSTPSTPTKIYAGYESMSYTDTSNNFYYSGIIVGTNNSGGTKVSAFTLYNPAGLSNLKVQNFKDSSSGSFFYVYNTSTSQYLMYAGGSQFFGQLADGSSSNTNYALKLINSSTYNGNVINLFDGYPYSNQHIVTSTGVYGAGQNNASPYTGSLGINSTTNALNYSICPLPSGVSDLSTVRIYHCINRTYMWDGSNIYSSGQDQTYSTAPASNIYILDTPSN